MSEPARQRPGRHRRRAASAALSGLAVLMAASCSGSSGSSGAPVPTSPSIQTASSATRAAAPSVSGAPTASRASRPVKAVPVESNPPGDIPDNIAFVVYRNTAGGYSFTHPEGWARTVRGAAVRLTDKLNGVTADVVRAAAPTVASATMTDVPRLRAAVPAFALTSVSAVAVPGGRGVRIVFRRNSDADAVTGRVYRDEVEEYILPHNGNVLRLDLYGPVGADNVDAYRTIVGSVRWS